MTLLANSRLGPYEIVGLLGAGGMGEVYRARDPRLGREVAVKVLPSEVASDSARLSLFEREARAVAALNHPNILTVHDVGTHDGTPYVVTELLEGETLRELVSRRSPTAQQILGYALQAARGLEAAHAKGIVHRDLKPENLFLTTDGRVKVLDFGLAKLVRSGAEITSEVSTAVRSTPPGQVAGTVLYMSPEQARAQPVDARSDVFSFGVVLYELLAGKHPFRKDTVAGTLTAIVEETPPDLKSLGRAVPPAAGGIVRRCLQKAREDRYASGHDVAMVLEAVLAAPSGAAALREVEERSPYPGLGAFTEKDAAVFFGREREVEELWARIPNRRLLAVIGPSGAGKTSFVRAGILPARPEGWAALVCTPGVHPFRALGQALGPELAGDTEALGKLVGLDDPDTAVELFGRWRGHQGEALLVVDQFEELITLSPPEARARFAGLLGRLASDADVHVVLSLRDDFLIRCVEHEALAPVLEGLTALLALKPEDLRRAIEEPAKKQGYRFEDESLVDEMVESVEGARAALPLLAFAVSRLWEKRDREKKVLTRTAYEEIGGVAGALAQHAEQTMDRIGAERQGMVREIFRNLVTAQGTRAVADREELLSVFPERKVAEEVLAQLIDARLLTSYETEEPGLSSRGARPAAGDEGSAAVATHRIEVAHESLLKAWPRLVRWQAQDEEGAVLRDQLKQAAHVWEERGRSPDVLWSGTALREYELWRERYAGKLTVVEESFADAMLERDRRRRRWRRAAVTAAMAILATVAISVTLSRQEAVRQARLAEAAEIVALGRNELEKYPTATLAYARKSLEVADTASGRQLAVAALWQAPPARILPLGGAGTFRGGFSPDGTLFAVYTFSQKVNIFADSGVGDQTIEGFEQLVGPPALWFAPSGDSLLTMDNVGGRILRAVSIPEGREIFRSTLEPVGGDHACGLEGVAQPDGLLFSFDKSPPPHRGPGVKHLVRWPYDGGTPELLGSYRGVEGALDAAGSRLAIVRDGRLLLRPVRGDGESGERLLGTLGEGGPVLYVPAFSPRGEWLAVGQASGRLTVWPTAEPTDDARPRELQLDDPEGMFPLRFDSDGSHLVWGSSANRSVSVWDLEGPPAAEPLRLPRSDAPMTKQGVFHPREPWLAVVNMGTIAFWAYDQPRRYVLRGHKGITPGLGFTPDARFLVSCGEDGGYVWPLAPQAAAGKRWFRAQGWCYGDHLPFLPDGSAFLNCYFGVVQQPLDGSDPRVVFRPERGSREVLGGCGIDSTGRRAALTVDIAPAPERKVLRLLDLESGQTLRSWPLVPEGESGDGQRWSAASVLFRGTEVLAGGSGGLRWFDMESGDTGWIRRIDPERAVKVSMSRDGRRLLIVEGKRGLPVGREGSQVTLLDADGSERAIRSHSRTVNAVALDPSGKIMVTGDMDGIVRVGSVDGSPPHLLLGHTQAVGKVVVSPDGQWIASKASSEIILWRMPDLSKPPLHALPYDELMAKLGSFTNLEVVEDDASSTGYRLELGPFPGWRDVPTW